MGSPRASQIYSVSVLPPPFCMCFTSGKWSYEMKPIDSMRNMDIPKQKGEEGEIFLGTFAYMIISYHNAVRPDQGNVNTGAMPSLGNAFQFLEGTPSLLR